MTTCLFCRTVIDDDSIVRICYDHRVGLVYQLGILMAHKNAVGERY